MVAGHSASKHTVAALLMVAALSEIVGQFRDLCKPAISLIDHISWAVEHQKCSRSLICQEIDSGDQNIPVLRKSRQALDTVPQAILRRVARCRTVSTEVERRVGFVIKGVVGQLS